MTCKANNCFFSSCIAQGLTREAEPAGGNFFIVQLFITRNCLAQSRSWLSRADIHRASSQEGERTSRLGPRKEKFGGKGILQKPGLSVLELNTWPKSQ